MIALFRTLYNRYGYLPRYGIAGLIGGLIQEGTLYLWVEIFGKEEYYLLGVVFGFCAALAIVFPIQKYWTFRDDTTHRTRTQFIAYGMIALGSLLANVLLMHLFVEYMGIGIYIAQALTIVLVAGASFLLNRFITFRSGSVLSAE